MSKQLQLDKFLIRSEEINKNEISNEELQNEILKLSSREFRKQTNIKDIIINRIRKKYLKKEDQEKHINNIKNYIKWSYEEYIKDPKYRKRLPNLVIMNKNQRRPQNEFVSQLGLQKTSTSTMSSSDSKVTVLLNKNNESIKENRPEVFEKHTKNELQLQLPSTSTISSSDSKKTVKFNKNFEYIKENNRPPIYEKEFQSIPEANSESKKNITTNEPFPISSNDINYNDFKTFSNVKQIISFKYKTNNKHQIEEHSRETYKKYILTDKKCYMNDEILRKLRFAPKPWIRKSERKQLKIAKIKNSYVDLNKNNKFHELYSNAVKNPSKFIIDLINNKINLENVFENDNQNSKNEQPQQQLVIVDDDVKERKRKLSINKENDGLHENKKYKSIDLTENSSEDEISLNNINSAIDNQHGLSKNFQELSLSKSSNHSSTTTNLSEIIQQNIQPIDEYFLIDTIYVQPKELSFEDFLNHTNIKVFLKQKLQKIYTEDSDEYKMHLSKLLTYAKSFYNNVFIINDDWPKGILMKKGALKILHSKKKKQHESNKEKENLEEIPDIQLPDFLTSIYFETQSSTFSPTSSTTTVTFIPSLSKEKLQEQPIFNTKIEIKSFRDIPPRYISFDEFKNLTNIAEFARCFLLTKNVQSNSKLQEKFMKDFYKNKFSKLEKWPVVLGLHYNAKLKDFSYYQEWQQQRKNIENTQQNKAIESSDKNDKKDELKKMQNEEKSYNEKDNKNNEMNDDNVNIQSTPDLFSSDEIAAENNDNLKISVEEVKRPQKKRKLYTKIFDESFEENDNLSSNHQQKSNNISEESVGKHTKKTTLENSKNNELNEAFKNSTQNVPEKTVYIEVEENTEIQQTSQFSSSLTINDKDPLEESNDEVVSVYVPYEDDDDIVLQKGTKSPSSVNVCDETIIKDTQEFNNHKNPLEDCELQIKKEKLTQKLVINIDDSDDDVQFVKSASQKTIEIEDETMGTSQLIDQLMSGVEKITEETNYDIITEKTTEIQNKSNENLIKQLQLVMDDDKKEDDKLVNDESFKQLERDLRRMVETSSSEDDVSTNKSLENNEKSNNHEKDSGNHQVSSNDKTVNNQSGNRKNNNSEKITIKVIKINFEIKKEVEYENEKQAQYCQSTVEKEKNSEHSSVKPTSQSDLINHQNSSSKPTTTTEKTTSNQNKNLKRSKLTKSKIPMKRTKSDSEFTGTKSSINKKRTRKKTQQINPSSLQFIHEDFVMQAKHNFRPLELVQNDAIKNSEIDLTRIETCELQTITPQNLELLIENNVSQILDSTQNNNHHNAVPFSFSGLLSHDNTLFTSSQLQMKGYSQPQIESQNVALNSNNEENVQKENNENVQKTCDIELEAVEYPSLSLIDELNIASEIEVETTSLNCLQDHNENHMTQDKTINDIRVGQLLLSQLLPLVTQNTNEITETEKLQQIQDSLQEFLVIEEKQQPKDSLNPKEVFIVETSSIEEQQQQRSANLIELSPIREQEQQQQYNSNFVEVLPIEEQQQQHNLNLVKVSPMEKEKEEEEQKQHNLNLVKVSPMEKEEEQQQQQYSSRLIEVSPIKDPQQQSNLRKYYENGLDYLLNISVESILPPPLLPLSTTTTNYKESEKPTITTEQISETSKNYFFNLPRKILRNQQFGLICYLNLQCVKFNLKLCNNYELHQNNTNSKIIKTNIEYKSEIPFLQDQQLQLLQNHDDLCYCCCCKKQKMEAIIKFSSNGYNQLNIYGNSLKFLFNLNDKEWLSLIKILQIIENFEYNTKDIKNSNGNSNINSSISLYQNLSYKILYTFFKTLPKFSKIIFEFEDSNINYICLKRFNVHLIKPIKFSIKNVIKDFILESMENINKTMRKSIEDNL